ncbi:MAG: hypothetical protein ABI451_02145 [Dokdonella sp.]
MVNINKDELIQALLPLLIAKLQEHFSPSEQGAETCLEAARGWADALSKAAEAKPDYNIFFI